MTKAELESRVKYLEERVEELEGEIEGNDEYIGELENENYDLTNNIGVGIKDIDNFKFRLQSESLYTQELEAFIENYLKFHND